LLVSQPLSPTHGLEPGVDFIEINTPKGLLTAIGGVRAEPDAYLGMRARGRLKAEQFRASRVYPRLIADLRRDLEAFGSRRRPGVSAAAA
jgi:hypothetical protein